jgi:chromosome segregation ATPase
VRRAASRLARSRAQRLASDQPVTRPPTAECGDVPGHQARLDRQLARLQRQRSDAMEARDRVRSRLAAVEQHQVGSGRGRRSHRLHRRQPTGELTRLSGDLDAWQQRILDLDAAIARLHARQYAIPDTAPPRPGFDPARAVDNQKVRVRTGDGRADDLSVGIA